MILQQYKIVFAGSMGAGKTEAIKSLSEIPVLATEAFNTDQEAHEKLQTTVGIDYGEITLEDGVKIGLYGTPGQTRFDFIWSVICEGAIGIILLIDHSIETPLQELDTYLKTFKAHSHNIAIGITHVDQNKEKSLSIYRDWLKENQYSYPLFFIDARQPDHILLMIESLITALEVNYNLTS
ncbi:ATP/GTP-binding protein [Acinetobacter sp. S40]|uniref:GTP-binding protein n=1 Tax=Acinetobacter sp. S40 TaxID=2767434 RepID=UPI00190A9259|nr:ATP/GTP-binding protein [Acinetobacter sp. S40]MBJ9986353.1 ATP/GTP-binding protein [Acinetobacter sp. S40]